MYKCSKCNSNKIKVTEVTKDYISKINIKCTICNHIEIKIENTYSKYLKEQINYLIHFLSKVKSEIKKRKIKQDLQNLQETRKKVLDVLETYNI